MTRGVAPPDVSGTVAIVTAPIRDDLNAVIDREVLRLGREVSQGQIPRDAAVATLLKLVPDGLTRLGAADMLDHWDKSLPSYTGSFEMLIGQPEMFTSLSPERQLGYAGKLLSVIACADDIAALGHAVMNGSMSRTAATIALQAKLGGTHTANEASHVIGMGDMAGVHHSRAFRLLSRLYTKHAGNQPSA